MGSRMLRKQNVHFERTNNEKRERVGGGALDVFCLYLHTQIAREGGGLLCGIVKDKGFLACFEPKGNTIPGHRQISQVTAPAISLGSSDRSHNAIPERL